MSDDQDIDTTTLATDRECLEIEMKARTRKVMHWPELVRLINRMRHAEARAEKAEAMLRSVRAHGDLTQISDYFAALKEQGQ